MCVCVCVYVCVRDLIEYLQVIFCLNEVEIICLGTNRFKLCYPTLLILLTIIRLHTDVLNIAI